MTVVSRQGTLKSDYLLIYLSRCSIIHCYNLLFHDEDGQKDYFYTLPQYNNNCNIAQLNQQTQY